MSDFFEISYAAAQKRICFFTGTGFSKAVTAGAAPSWQGLLKSVSDVLQDYETTKSVLFPENGENPLALEEAAQVLSIDLNNAGRSIHEEVAWLIKQLVVAGNNSEIVKFMSAEKFNAVTTNYDKLLEKLAGEKSCHSLSPGLPIPRSDSRVNVFHVHGSVDSPKNMVITSDDYFKFLNKESYFSRKLSTILHENTVVFLGYSLGDTNLKAIISDHRGFSKNHVVGSSIFFVSRKKIAQPIKDYYSHCYGIRVLDEMAIDDFFKKLNTQLPASKKRAEESIINIHNVLESGWNFTADYLGNEDSFYDIISAIFAVGQSIEGQRSVEVFGKIIETKVSLTKARGAWAQYEHLAKWLIYLASILELENTSIKNIFLGATLHSMNTMAKEHQPGSSWYAYSSWSNGWQGILASNRRMIRAHIEENPQNMDSLLLVRRMYS